MFYRFFVTVFMLFSIHIIFKAKPEWEDNSATTKKVLFCLVFMLIQSVVIAGLAMIIYSIWR